MAGESGWGIGVGWKLGYLLFHTGGGQCPSIHPGTLPGRCPEVPHVEVLDTYWAPSAQASPTSDYPTRISDGTVSDTPYLRSIS